MAELRYNALFREWVLYVPERSDPKKPHDTGTVSPSQSRMCPFDSDAFLKDQGVIDAYPSLDRWIAVISPDKYGGMSRSTSLKTLSSEYFFKTMNGYGIHDVIVFSDHNKRISHYDAQEFFHILEMLKKRIISVDADASISSYALIQRCGFKASASLSHPHMHLIFSPIIPGELSSLLSTCYTYFQEERETLLEGYIRREIAYGDRIIFQDPYAVSLVQYAGLFPADIIVAPQKAYPHMHMTPEIVMQSMARALIQTLRLLDEAFHTPDYGLHLYSAPLQDGGLYPYMHWFFRITPRFSVQGPSESGIPIVTLLPEVAASRMRTTTV